MCHRLLLVVILCLPAIKAFCSGYGPCPFAYPQHQHYVPKKFIPAPKGQTPNCAIPGLTFCVDVDNYPKQIVKHLIQKMEFNFNTLLRDESKDNFGKRDYVPYGVNLETSTEFQGYDYSPAVQHPPQHHAQGAHHQFASNPQVHSHYDERRLPSFTTTESYTERSYPAITTAESSNHFDNFQSLASDIPYSQPFFNDKLVDTFFKSDSTYYNPIDWFKRLCRFKRSNQSEEFSSAPKARRRQRQANNNGGGFTETLCPTRSMYATPKAALNNQGAWKYVVNLNNDKFTQYVRSEVCVSSQCNNFCSLPNGYSSRCEQKYVQKRLVALSDDGNQIYTDVFWFPHGCVCQFSTAV